MLRFIIKETTRDQGHVRSFLETIDVSSPTLEKALRRSGYGGGPNGDDFLYCEVTGVEVLKDEDTNG